MKRQYGIEWVEADGTKGKATFFSFVSLVRIATARLRDGIWQSAKISQQLPKTLEELDKWIH